MPLTPNTRVLQLARVRLLVQEPTASYWTDALLNIYINEAQVDIATGCVPGIATGQEEPLLASEAFTASVTDQELYSLPPNYHAIRTVRARSTASEDFTEIPGTDIEYARAHPRTSSNRPEAHFLWGESGTYQLGVYPAFNSANGRLYVTYWRLPDEMTQDSASLQIPTELHIANTYLAAAKAWLERGDKSRYGDLLEMFKIEYQAKLPYVRRRQINAERAVRLGDIGDTDRDRVLF